MPSYFCVLTVAFGAFALGCANTDASSIYDLHSGAYEGGGPTSADPIPTNSMEAGTCAVQGRASITGSLLGSAFSAKDAVEIFVATEAKYKIEITDYASACSLGESLHQGSHVISIGYTNPLLSSGTFDVTKTEGMSADYAQYDATCKASKSEAASSGTITFTRVDTCGAEGSFDLVFGADHVTATFTASVCSVTSGTATCD